MLLNYQKLMRIRPRQKTNGRTDMSLYLAKSLFLFKQRVMPFFLCYRMCTFVLFCYVRYISRPSGQTDRGKFLCFRNMSYLYCSFLFPCGRSILCFICGLMSFVLYCPSEPTLVAFADDRTDERAWQFLWLKGYIFI